MKLYASKDFDSSEGTVQLHSPTSDGHLLYHPRPNLHDPNDPLRWPTWKKYAAFTSVCTFGFLTNYGIGGLAPAFYLLSKEFHKSQNETSNLLLWPILILGIGNFFWVPVGNYIGKRPVFVLSTFILALTYLWGALAPTFSSLLWSNIIASFAGAASEAVAVSTVNDLFYLHERANLMGWYMNAVNGGNTIGPIVCGFIVTGTSWRLHKWIAFGLMIGNFFFVLFLYPETRYDRIYPEPELPSTPSEPFDVGKDPETSDSTRSFGPAHRASTAPLSPIPRKTWRQELSLFSGLPRDTTLFRLFLRPFPTALYPAVIFAFLAFSITLSCIVAINILNSFVLQAPPYNWRPSINGLINIAGLIGNLFGSWVGGWVVDRYSDWQSRRHHGLFQPETRLHLLLIPTIIVPAGCLAWGYGATRHLHWTSLFFANGMVNVGISAIPTILMTYVSDCYLPINADILTLVVGLKNVVAFGFLRGVVPWTEVTSQINVFGSLAGIYVAIMALAIPFVCWGGSMRHHSASWKILP